MTTTATLPTATPVKLSEEEAAAIRSKPAPAMPPTKPATKPRSRKRTAAKTAKTTKDPKTTKTKRPYTKPTAGALKGRDGKDRNAKALKMREAGKSYAEITKAIGWANPGIAWNSVARGIQERDGVAVPKRTTSKPTTTKAKPAKAKRPKAGASR